MRVGDTIVVSEQKSEFASGLFLGVTLGGAIGGILGAVLVPKLLERSQKSSKRMRDAAYRSDSNAEDRMLTHADADAQIAQARQSLEDKIAQLNAAIEDTRSRLADPDRATAPFANGSHPHQS